MRVLMLGWEFPPYISGGLGTACYGLTRALDALGHAVTFVLPKGVDQSHASHIKLLTPDDGAAKAGDLRNAEAAFPQDPVVTGGGPFGDPISYTSEEFENVVFKAIPTSLRSPYPGFNAPPPLTEEQRELLRRHMTERRALLDAGVPIPPDTATGEGDYVDMLDGSRSGDDYGGDIINDSRRYARLCVHLTRGEQYDVIHAHDWMTYPAGLAVARATGTPLVVHLHSTEFDRSGENVNQSVYDIERRGMHGADRVITVSRLTKSIAERRYGVDPRKITVVYNGLHKDETNDLPDPQPIMSTDRIVLFLGRLTFQKGPEYFIAAAKRVLEKMDNVKFVVAGSGDMARAMIEQAAQLGIGQRFLFAGFLRGRDVDRVFKMAECYVMPSVSEPFGIAPLEAMSHDVPTIISKQSGVSEVLEHVLKVDFWDVDDIANKVLAVLRHPPLSQTLREHGSFEVRRLTWDIAARHCADVYREAMGTAAVVTGVG
ncbi:MAG: glycosyltransferase [Phycisphaerales bacterium]|nr:glycosyltransferase [Phycisphaerales bacterium]